MSKLYAVEVTTKDNQNMIYLLDVFAEYQAKMIVESYDLGVTIDDIRPAEPRDINLFAEQHLEPVIMH